MQTRSPRKAFIAAAAGAAIGAGTRYLVGKEKQKEQAAQQKAYNEGVQVGKQQAQK